MLLISFLAFVTTSVGEEPKLTPVNEDNYTEAEVDLAFASVYKLKCTLNRVVVRLGDSKLTTEDEEQIRRAKSAIGTSR